MSQSGKHVKISLSESNGVIVANPASASVYNGDTVVWERGALQDKPIRIHFTAVPSPANGTFLVDRHGNLSLVMNNETRSYAYVVAYVDGGDPGEPPTVDPPPVIIIQDGGNKDK